MMDMEAMTEILNTPMPTAASEAAAEVDASKMKSDTQILLAIFEKVVCIESMLEGEQKAASPVQLPSSLMLEGEC